MRRFEFRVWHKTLCKMIHGSPSEVFQWKRERQPVIIMQWSGLRDKDGVQIFEGDYIELGEPDGEKVICRIFFQGGSFCIVPSWTDNMEPVSLWAYCNEIFSNCVRVIGNVFENPEIQETGKEGKSDQPQENQ